MGTFILWSLAFIGGLFILFKFFGGQSPPTQPSKPEYNPLKEELQTFSLNQKFSLVNLLMIIGHSDMPNGNPDKEVIHLNNMIRLIGVRADDSRTYFANNGKGIMAEELDTLNGSQKDTVLLMVWDMITCDGRANELEVVAMAEWLGYLGLSEKYIVEKLNKTAAIMDYLKL